MRRYAGRLVGILIAFAAFPAYASGGIGALIFALVYLGTKILITIAFSFVAINILNKLERKSGTGQHRYWLITAAALWTGLVVISLLLAAKPQLILTLQFHELTPSPIVIFNTVPVFIVTVTGFTMLLYAHQRIRRAVNMASRNIIQKLLLILTSYLLIFPAGIVILIIIFSYEFNAMRPVEDKLLQKQHEKERIIREQIRIREAEEKARREEERKAKFNKINEERRRRNQPEIDRAVQALQNLTAANAKDLKPLDYMYPPPTEIYPQLVSQLPILAQKLATSQSAYIPQQEVIRPIANLTYAARDTMPDWRTRAGDYMLHMLKTIDAANTGTGKDCLAYHELCLNLIEALGRYSERSDITLVLKDMFMNPKNAELKRYLARVIVSLGHYDTTQFPIYVYFLSNPWQSNIEDKLSQARNMDLSLLDNATMKVHGHEGKDRHAFDWRCPLKDIPTEQLLQLDTKTLGLNVEKEVAYEVERQKTGADCIPPSQR